MLLVLKRPDIVLHTNGSEGDIRGHVKWRKISGGTRSALGKRCRDGFASLKKTCRKLGISSGTISATALADTAPSPLCPTSSASAPLQQAPCPELLRNYAALR